MTFGTYKFCALIMTLRKRFPPLYTRIFMSLNIFGKRTHEMTVWKIIIRDRRVYCCACKFYIYLVCSTLHKSLSYAFVVCVWHSSKLITKTNLASDLFNNHQTYQFVVPAYNHIVPSRNHIILRESTFL